MPLAIVFRSRTFLCKIYFCFSPLTFHFICINCTDHHTYFYIFNDLTTQGVPYDYKSIMHYEYLAASKNSQPTMEPLNPNITLEDLGSALAPTEYDYLHLNLLYCQGNVKLSVVINPSSFLRKYLYCT